MSDQPKFQQWAIVELFGHQRIAGLVSEQAVGGCSFVRVDVPHTKASPEWTKLLGNGAIYAINFVTEEVAKLAAESYQVAPVSPWQLTEGMRALQDRSHEG